MNELLLNEYILASLICYLGIVIAIGINTYSLHKINNKIIKLKDSLNHINYTLDKLNFCHDGLQYQANSLRNKVDALYEHDNLEYVKIKGGMVKKKKHENEG